MSDSKEASGMQHNTPVSRVPRSGNALRQHTGLMVIALLSFGLCFVSPAPALNSDMVASTSLYQSQRLSDLGLKKQANIRQLIEAIGAFADGEYGLAKRIFVPLAGQGVGEAQFYLGLMYDSGLGVKKDLVQAFEYYHAAATGGHPGAQHNLAVAYASGEGVEVNPVQALRWWRSAARQGNADAQYNLGIVYAVGKLGVARDLGLAKKWWRKAAISGDAMAQYNLGILYVKGSDTVRSYCEAVRWWEKSAEKGVSQAAVALKAIKSRKDYNSCW